MVTGNTVVYEIKVKNLGPSNATGVVLTGRAAGRPVRRHHQPGRLHRRRFERELRGRQPRFRLTWTVEVSGTVAVGTTELTNNASATGNEFDPNLSNNHDDVTTPVGKSADLSIVRTPIRPGRRRREHPLHVRGQQRRSR